MRTSMQTWLSRLVVITGLGLGAVSAQAGGGVYWAVNVDAPVQGVGRVSTAVSNTRGGVHAHPGVVVYAPPPVVVHHPRPPVVWVPGHGYGPVPVVYAPPTRMYREDRARWGRDHRGHHHHHHHEHRHGGRDDRGGRDDDRHGWRRD